MSKYINRFKSFVLHQSFFNKEEQESIIESLENENIQRRLKLVMILFSWALVSLWIESFLVGGGFLFSLLHGIDWRYFLPEAFFLVLNFFVKFFYIRWYMNEEISLQHTLYASLPGVGAIIIFGILIRDNLLLMKAFRSYIRHLRKKYFLSIFRNK